MDKKNENNKDTKNNDEDQNLVEETEMSIDDERIEKLEELVADLDSKWKRALADYQNQEKWMRDQRGEWIKAANRELLLRILPVLDTLMLAQQHSKDQSLQVSVDQFLSVIKEEGITKIETVGKEFDPFIMEAISTENGKENKVISEVRSGYMLFDKVLRPAQVTVGNGEKSEN